MPPAPVIPTTALSVTDILRIQNWATKGVSTRFMARLLGVSPEYFYDLEQQDPRIREAIDLGLARGVEAAATALFEAVRGGKDVSATKFYLQSLARDHWSKPAAPGPIVTIYSSPPPVLDVEAMQRRFDRQAALLDCTAEDLEEPHDEPPDAG